MPMRILLHDPHGQENKLLPLHIKGMEKLC
jgi:hypothetical protein